MKVRHVTDRRIDQSTHLAASLYHFFDDSIHMPSRANQHRLLRRFQRRHLADCQWPLLILPHLLCTVAVAPLHWRYWWIVSRRSRENGSVLGPFQGPRLLGYRGQRCSLCVYGHHHFLQFLATSNANHCGVHEL